MADKLPSEIHQVGSVLYWRYRADRIYSCYTQLLKFEKGDPPPFARIMREKVTVRGEGHFLFNIWEPNASDRRKLYLYKKVP